MWLSMYPSLLKSVTSVSADVVEQSQVNKYRLITGLDTETERINNDGKVYRTKLSPAYEYYGSLISDMGSKIYVDSNKNMLAQNAATNTYFPIWTGM